MKDKITPNGLMEVMFRNVWDDRLNWQQSVHKKTNKVRVKKEGKKNNAQGSVVFLICT
jgi:hypothetical protein